MKHPIRMRKLATNLDLLLGVTKFKCRGCLCLSCEKTLRASTLCGSCRVRKDQGRVDKRIARLCVDFIVTRCDNYAEAIPYEVSEIAEE